MSNIGLLVSKAVADIVAVGAKDKIADSKLHQAIAYVNDPSMPCLDKSSDAKKAIVLQFGAIAESSTLYGILDESMASMAEALALMSPIRRSEVANDLRQWLERVQNLFELVEISKITFMQHLGRKCGLQLALAKVVQPNGEQLKNACLACDQPIKVFVDGFIGSASQMTSLTCFKNFVNTLPDDCDVSSGLLDAVQDSLVAYGRSGACMSCALELVNSVAAFNEGVFPSDIADAIGGYEVAFESGEIGASFIYKTMALQTAFEALSERSYDLGATHAFDSVVLVGALDSSSDTIEIDWQVAIDFPATACSEAVLLHGVIQMGASSVPQVLDDIQQSIKLDGFIDTPPPAEAGDTDVIATVVQHTRLEKEASHTYRILGGNAQLSLMRGKHVLFARLFKAFKVDEIVCKAGLFNTGDEDISKPADRLSLMIELASVAYDLCSLFSCVRIYLHTDKLPLLLRDGLPPQLVNACDHIGRACKALDLQLGMLKQIAEKEGAPFKDFEADVLKPPHVIDAWLQRCCIAAERVRYDARVEYEAFISANAVKLNELTLDDRPYISTIYNAALVRKHLQHWPRRSQHEQATMASLKAGLKFKSTVKSLYPNDDLRDISGDAMKLWEEAFTGGKRLVAIFAIVDAIEVEKGEQQQTKSAELLTRYDTDDTKMPLGLILKLREAKTPKVAVAKPTKRRRVT